MHKTVQHCKTDLPKDFNLVLSIFKLFWTYIYQIIIDRHCLPHP